MKDDRLYVYSNEARPEVVERFKPLRQAVAAQGLRPVFRNVNPYVPGSLPDDARKVLVIGDGPQHSAVVADAVAAQVEVRRVSEQEFLATKTLAEYGGTAEADAEAKAAEEAEKAKADAEAKAAKEAGKAKEAGGK